MSALRKPRNATFQPASPEIVDITPLVTRGASKRYLAPLKAPVATIAIAAGVVALWQPILWPAISWLFKVVCR